MDQSSIPSVKVEIGQCVSTLSICTHSSNVRNMGNEDTSSVEVFGYDPSVIELTSERLYDFELKMPFGSSSRVIGLSEFCETITLPRRVDFNSLVVHTSDKIIANVDHSRRVTCAISTADIYNYSFIYELLSSFKLLLLTIPCIICGIGYGGRVSISSFYGILETIHACSSGTVTFALSHAVFIIRNEVHHRKWVFALPWIFHSVLATSVYFNHLIWGHLINCSLTFVFMLAVYLFVSRGLHVRASYFFFWFNGMVLLSCVILVMLRLKLWTEILWTLLPADYLLIKMVVHATKTFDRLVFLQVAAISYCCLIENLRFLSLYGIIKEEVYWTWNLVYFLVSDIICCFISKSEILHSLKRKLGCSKTTSQTKLLASRITRACVNLTNLCLPIWSIGFDIGQFWIKDELAFVTIKQCFLLLICMHYVPEFLSEMGLYLYVNSSLGKRMFSDDHTFQRINFIASIKSDVFFTAYLCVPGMLIALRVIELV